MSRFHLAAAAAALTLGLGAAASAEATYPRLVGSGESLHIEYGPEGQGNVLGGGQVQVTGQGEDARTRHLEGRFAQAPRPGEVPVMVGSGEGRTTIWVPAGFDRARLALLGADGALPQASRPSRG